MAMPAFWQAPSHSQPDSEHDARMAKSLRTYISDSMTGVPGDLPELKGLHAKLPEAYEGEDDFDHLKSWLQGLLHFFKLHCLVGRDRDGDRILVTGSCLKGQAERWFNHEVERPQRLVCSWTFESIILGLYRSFITTAMSQQAVLKYTCIRFSLENGVHAFYRELLMWARRLAHYPDPYSFKRRLLNGLPTKYQNHLTLYKGVSAKHSSIDDIILKARRYEKAMATMVQARNVDRDRQPRGPDHNTHWPEMQTECATQHSRPRLFRSQLGRSDTNAAPTKLRVVQVASPRDCRDTTALPGRTTAPTGQTDTSKLTCFKCGKLSHIVSNLKCPQYKKPEQRQMFAAQVVDDLSDTEALVHSSDTFDDGQLLDSEGLGEEEIDPDAKLHVLPEEDDGPDGTQYDEDVQAEDSYYKEYDGYAAPSDDDDLEYLRCMRAVESDSKSSPPLLGDTQEVGSKAEVNYPQLEDLAWELRQDAICERYQRLHWFPHDQWEFRPHVGVTHICNCMVCVEYKEHCIAAEALAQDLESEAWRNCDNYE
jgi:hypothetical protein